MYEKIKFFVDYDNRETEECYVAFFKIGKILLSDFRLDTEKLNLHRVLSRVLYTMQWTRVKDLAHLHMYTSNKYCCCGEMDATEVRK